MKIAGANWCLVEIHSLDGSVRFAGPLLMTLDQIKREERDSARMLARSSGSRPIMTDALCPTKIKVKSIGSAVRNRIFNAIPLLKSE